MARTQIDLSLINALNTTFVGAGRNRIINGDMGIDQANSGAAVSVTANTTFYDVDRFLGQGVASSGVFSLQQSTSTPPTGFIYFMRASCTTADASIAAGDRYRVNTRVEGLNMRDFLFGTAGPVTVTLSFWVRSSLTGTYSGSLENGAGDRSYPYEYTINAANTWEKKSVTVVGDTTGTWLTDTGIGMRVNWALAIGTTYQGTANTWQAGDFLGTANQVNFMSTNTSRTWDITGVQLEIGSVATSFEYRPFPMELAMCQRYLQIITSGAISFYGMGQCFTTTTGEIVLPLKVTMRTSPTGTITNQTSFGVYTAAGAGNNFSAFSVSDTTTNFVRLGFTAGTANLVAGNAALFFSSNANAKLTFSAEL